MKKVVPEGEEKLYYAQAKSAGTCTFDDLCEQIADSSTASTGDVKIVLDRLNRYMSKALARGEIVQLGELGNFQVILGSTGTLTEEDFNSSMIRKPRLTFRPGSMLRNLIGTVSFERFSQEKCEKQHVV